MIATNRRMAIHDFLLVAFAVIAISLAIFPEQAARQTLLVRDSAGNVQEYSLKADDPRLADIERKIENWPRRIRSPKLALQKWYAETAEYYAARTEPPENDHQPFVAASFSMDDSKTSYGGELDHRDQEHQHWLRVAADAREVITKAEIEIQRRQHMAGPPPITLGHIDSGGHSPQILILAGIFGVCIATGFARWTYVSPTRKLKSLEIDDPNSSEGDNRDGDDEPLQLAIPPSWVRLHQPTSVVIRQNIYRAVLIAGVVCAAL